MAPLDVVTKLNDEINDLLKGEYGDFVPELVYHTNGVWGAITFGEEPIWHSDDGPWDDEPDDRGSVECWVRKKIAERVRLFGKLLVLAEPVKE